MIKQIRRDYIHQNIDANRIGAGRGSRSKGVEYEISRNRIVFGAPGTGKSNRLEKDRLAACLNDAGEIIVNRNSKGDAEGAEDDRRAFKDENFERVTFYPTYSYAQFVGTYKPMMNGADIKYEFVPGPFLRLLVEAIKAVPDENNHCQKNCLLIIEEINRANAAAVFGDMFQVLDRDGSGDSEYGITVSEDIRKYLAEVLKENFNSYAWDGKKLRLPSNFYIWATMNSADQGVYPLDTAFKRRWSFEYINVDGGCPKLWIENKKGCYQWDELRKEINERLLDVGKVNEDKLLGPWFLKGEDGDTISSEVFGSKVLMYLWEDAARMCRKTFFSSEIRKFSDLLEKWDEAEGTPDDANGTLTNVIPFASGVRLKFSRRVSENGKDGLFVEIIKDADGNPVMQDGKFNLAVKFNGGDVNYDVDMQDEGRLVVKIDDESCYGEVELVLGPKMAEEPPAAGLKEKVLDVIQPSVEEAK